MAVSLPTIFIPGSLCDERLFTPQLDELGEFHAVVARYNAEDKTIAEMAQRILDVFEGPLNIVGLSQGGIVAFEICRRAPERVATLALLDTNPSAEREERKPIRAEQIEQCRQQGVGFILELLEGGLYDNYVAKSRLNDAHIKSTVFAMAEDAGVEIFESHWSALLTRQDSWPSLEGIRCPTLIVCGEEDALCPPVVHEKMAELIAGSQLHILPNVGHLSTLEAPAKVNELLRKHLRGQHG